MWIAMIAENRSWSSTLMRSAGGAVIPSRATAGTTSAADNTRLACPHGGVAPGSRLDEVRRRYLTVASLIFHSHFW